MIRYSIIGDSPTSYIYVDIENLIFVINIWVLILQRDFAETARFGLLIAEPDRKCWEKICRSFLKGR